MAEQNAGIEADNAAADHLRASLRSHSYWIGAHQSMRQCLCTRKHTGRGARGQAGGRGRGRGKGRGRGRSRSKDSTPSIEISEEDEPAPMSPAMDFIPLDGGVVQGADASAGEDMAAQNLKPESTNRYLQRCFGQSYVCCMTFMACLQPVMAGQKLFQQSIQARVERRSVCCAHTAKWPGNITHVPAMRHITILPQCSAADCVMTCTAT